MLHGAAPDYGRAARPTAAHVEFVCVWNPRQPGSLGISRDEAESLGLSLSTNNPQITPWILHRSFFKRSWSGTGFGLPSVCCSFASFPDPQITQDSSTERTVSALHELSELQALHPEDGVVIYPSPSAGRGLGETGVTVRLDWMGLPWVRPFWAGFRPYREARPLHTCGLAKKEQL